jgi:hypothetical protein
MEILRQQLEVGDAEARLDRDAQLRLRIGAKRESLTPKVLVQNFGVNVRRPLGIANLVRICNLTAAERTRQEGRRRPRYDLRHIDEVFSNYRPDEDDFQLRLRPTTAFDDHLNSNEIVVDILALHDYVTEVITNNDDLTDTNWVRHNILQTGPPSLP